MTTQALTEGDRKPTAEILEIDVWDLVLKKLEDPKDLYAAHNSCSTFSKLVTKKRPTFLFSSVFPILMKNGLSISPQEVVSYQTFDKRVLWLRSVCKSWKSEVDAHFQSLEYFESYERFQLPSFDPFEFESPEEVQQFLEQMAKHSSNDNPFITGFVWLSDYKLRFENNELVNFWGAVTSSLLPKFGKHILYSTISLQDLVEFRGYPILEQVLSQMPALRFVYVYANFEDHTRLKEEVARTPLPDFKQLKTLNIAGTGVTVTKELLRAASQCQLENLIVDLRDHEDEAIFNSFLWEELPKLRSLEQLTFTNSAVTSYSFLVMMSNTRWSIKVLDVAVMLFNDLEEDDISVPRLFQALSSQGDKSTIRSLELYLQGPGKINADVRLDLPHLEHLCLRSCDTRFAVDSLDFVVEMKALKFLSITVEGLFPTNKNNLELINFSGFVADMKASNIWTVLPNLEKLRLCDRGECRQYDR